MFLWRGKKSIDLNVSGGGVPSFEERERKRAIALTKFGYAVTVVMFVYGMAVALWPKVPSLSVDNNSGQYARIITFAASTAISVFSGILSFLFTIHIKLETYADHLKRTLDQLDKVVDCRYLGLGTQSIGPIEERIKNAQSVRNTLIFFDLSEAQVVNACYSKAQIEKLQTSISQFLDKGGSWTDVVSQDVVNSEHLNWLTFLARQTKGDCSQQTDAISTATKVPTEPNHNHPRSNAPKDHYSIRCLNESYPVLNFMILQYGDGDEEVIFGQGHHSEDPSGRVYLSRNSKLIETFDKYWKVLLNDSVPFEPGRTKPVSPTDITGMWIRASVNLKGGDWAVNGLPSKEVEAVDFAFVKISVSESRKIIVEGRRYCPQSPFNRTRGFRSIATDLADSRLWFATDSSMESKLHRAGWYKFIRPPDFVSKAKKIREFYGEFLKLDEDNNSLSASESGSRSPTDKLMVIGARLDEETFDEQSLRRAFPAGVPKAIWADFVDNPDTQWALNQLVSEWWNKTKVHKCHADQGLAANSR
jgi:hypothetical protein